MRPSDLHERYAAWLEATAEERMREFEEIVGYHLEQAYCYRTALGAPDSRAAALAARASDRLEAAGPAGARRSDLPAGIGLLERVTGCCPRSSRGGPCSAPSSAPR